MVDVVGVEAVLARGEREKVAERGNDVLVGEDLTSSSVEAELLVDLVAAHARQVVALRVEEQALEQAAGGIHGGGLAGTQATVDLDEGVLAGGAVSRSMVRMTTSESAEELENLVAVSAMPRARRNIVAGCLRLRSMTPRAGRACRPRTRATRRGWDDLRVVDLLLPEVHPPRRRSRRRASGPAG